MKLDIGVIKMSIYFGRETNDILFEINEVDCSQIGLLNQKHMQLLCYNKKDSEDANFEKHRKIKKVI